MTLAYVDTSWLITTRAAARPDRSLASAADGVDVFTTSELAGLELARTLLRADPARDWEGQVRDALAGIAALRLTTAVLVVASQLPVRFLRSLDAIHVASALLSRSDVVLTRDRQMTRACRELGLPVA